jgi:hypothetical protein
MQMRWCFSPIDQSRLNNVRSNSSVPRHLDDDIAEMLVGSRQVTETFTGLSRSIAKSHRKLFSCRVTIALLRDVSGIASSA